MSSGRDFHLLCALAIFGACFLSGHVAWGQQLRDEAGYAAEAQIAQTQDTDAPRDNAAFAQQLKDEGNYVASNAGADSQVMDFPRDNPAVTIISEDDKSSAKDAAVTQQGAPSFWDKIFAHGSPFYYGLTVGETYDDNIFIAQHKIGDFYTHVTPLIDLVRGDKSAIDANYLNVSFRPTIFLYDRESQQNRVDYYADALYQRHFTRLTLSLEQRFEEETDPSIDVGRFFKQDVYTTQLSADYAYNDKLSFGGSETQRLSFVSNEPPITETAERITDLYARYQLGSKLSLGLGPRLGFVDISGAPNQNYQDLLARLTYQATDRVNVSFEGGVEYRQFQGSANHLYPVFALNASYTPFDGTLLSLQAYRQDVISYGEVGSNFMSTQAQLNLRQRFFRNFFFVASAGYDLADYDAAQAGSTTPGRRRDHYSFASAGLEWDPREWINVSLRGQASADDSNFAGNSFNDSQIDMQSALQF
jgi:hypothetical protein